MEGGQQALQWLIPLFGGGLAGACVTILFSTWNARRLAGARQSAMIDALRAEVHSTILLCGQNAKLQHSALAPFVHLPSDATRRAAFEERQACPKLGPFQKDLEHYALAVLQINQLIDHYRLISPIRSQVNQAAIERDNLRNAIAAICAGDSNIEGVGPEGFLVFPTFAKSIAKNLERV